MSEWQTFCLNELANIVMGQSPDSASYNEVGIGDPFLQGCADFGKRYPATRVFCSDPKKMGERGSILISVRAPVGELNIADKDYCIGRGIAAINPVKANRDFLYNFLLYNKRLFSRYSQGSTFEAINSKDLNCFPIPCPSERNHQRKIARILTTVDKVIEQTEATIEKLKKIKQGMMYDLFARGIDVETGKLRLPYSEAPHLYKESELGWIPKEWDTLPLEKSFELLIDFRGKTPKKIGMEWGGGNIPALSANNVEMGRINFGKGTYYGSEALFDVWMTNGVPDQGDTIMTMEAPLGNVAQIPDNKKYILSQRVILIRPDPQLFEKDFYSYLLRTTYFQGELHKNSTGTTAQGIQQKKLLRILLPHPKSTQEQELIGLKMKATDNHLLSAQIMFLEKYLNIKQGLMQDLLTGKISVTISEEQPTQKKKIVQPAFKRVVLAAEITAQLYRERKFGSVKQEKIIYLCEKHIGLEEDIESQYYRQAAGPYDPKTKRSIENNFRKQKWFDVKREPGKRVKYIPLEKMGEHKKYFGRYFRQHSHKIHWIIELLRPFTSQQCEMVATLYAAWNDLLLKGDTPTDQSIIDEVLYRWHESKQLIDKNRWQKALLWMRKNKIVPAGSGKATKITGH